MWVFFARVSVVFAKIFTSILLIFCGIDFQNLDLVDPLQVAFVHSQLSCGANAGRKAFAGSILSEIAPLFGYYFNSWSHLNLWDTRSLVHLSFGQKNRIIRSKIIMAADSKEIVKFGNVLLRNKNKMNTAIVANKSN